MAKSKIDYTAFNTFDINEACDYFDSEKQTNWRKIGKFIVADGQEYAEVMLKEFDYDEVNDGEYAAFDAGVQYAFAKLNAAFEAAGIELEVQQADLVEAMGFVLVRVDDTPETFVLRALKKPVLQVESWI